MKHLLKKELRLAMHPTCLIFLALSALLLIPNYPYYVTFFYTGLGVFFTCLSGRENHDIFYTVTLPVPKSAAVDARIAFTVLLELAQMAAAVPFALLRARMPMPGNAVGMDANLAFFGLSFVLLGIFNLVFFGRYYRAPEKVGKAFAVSSTVVFIFIVIAETCAHAVPFVRDRLDTPDPAFLTEKLAVLAVGILFFAAATLLARRKAVRSFAALDL